MKAVILEIIKEKAVVMKENGTVRRVRNRNYSVGDEIYMKEGIFSHRKWAPIVAALLIFAMVGTGTWAYADGYELNAVDKDGMEFMIMVNKRDRVTSVKVDGVKIEFDEEFENKDVEEFLRELFEKHKIKAIAPIADSEEEEEQIAAMIKEMLKNENAVEAHERNEERKADQEDIADEINISEENMEIKGLSPEDVVRAKALGITPGKYNIITNLLGEVDKNYDDHPENVDSNFKDYIEKSNQVLMKEFTADKGEKNGVKFQDDEDAKEEIDNPSKDAPGQLKKEEMTQENDTRSLDKSEELEEDMGKPAGVGKPENTGKPEGVGKPEGTPGN